MKCAVLFFLVISALSACAQLPDAPQPSQPTPPAFKTWEAKAGQPAGFLTFRGDWKLPPLRTNKQVFKSKWVVIGGAMSFAAMATDIEYTHGARESWASEAPAFGATQALAYLTCRFFSCAGVPAIDGYITQHYLRDIWK